MKNSQQLKSELERLRLSEAYYRQLIDSAGDAIFVHDGETGELIDVDKTMLNRYKVTREQALASSADEFSACSPPYTMADAQEWLGRTIADIRLDGTVGSPWTEDAVPQAAR